MLGLGLKDEWKNGENGKKENLCEIVFGRNDHFSLLVNNNINRNRLSRQFNYYKLYQGDLLNG